MSIRAGIFYFLISTLIAPLGAQEEEPWPVRLREPRIAPLPESRWGDLERTLLVPEDQPALRQNIFRTLIHNAQLISAWGPFGRYILQQSTLPARDREILILRMGWLCQSGYEWGQHARIGLRAGLESEDLYRIAEGPDAEGWNDLERTLLRTVDELHYEAGLSDGTWKSLRDHYSLEQTVDAILTVGEYKMVGMALNSLGVQLDPDVSTLLPVGLDRPEPAGPPTLPLPDQARVEPLPPGQWNEGQQILLQPFAQEGDVGHAYATLVRHPSAFASLLPFQSYLMTESSLPDPVRRDVALRVFWLTRCGYEWAHHAQEALEAGLTEKDLEMLRRPEGAEGYPLIRAVDQLVYDSFIQDETWEALAETMERHQLIDFIFTVGGHMITAMTVNSLGVQLEPDMEQPWALAPTGHEEAGRP